MQDPFPYLLLARRSERLPPGGVYSGRTAGWLHGLDFEPCDPIEVTLPRLSRTSRLAGAALTRSDLRDSELSSVRGLPSTAGTRTAADLGRRLPIVDSVLALEASVRRRITTSQAVQSWISCHAGYRGIGRLREAVDLAEPLSESPMETRLRLLLVMSGLPRPAVQIPLHDQAGTFLGRSDLYYDREHIVIEYDGATHRTSIANDNRRQNRILEAGFHMLRFTAADVFRTPAAVVGQVERALAAG